jgi:hypothetical protein
MGVPLPRARPHRAGRAVRSRVLSGARRGHQSAGRATRWRAACRATRQSAQTSENARTGNEAPVTMRSGTAKKRKLVRGSPPRLQQRCSTTRISSARSRGARGDSDRCCRPRSRSRRRRAWAARGAGARAPRARCTVLAPSRHRFPSASLWHGTSSEERRSGAYAGRVKNSISSWLTRSASSWCTQCDASGRRSTRSRLGTSSRSGSARSEPR